MEMEARRKPRPLRRLQMMRRLMSEMWNILRKGMSSMRMMIPSDFRSVFRAMYSCCCQPRVFLKMIVLFIVHQKINNITNTCFLPMA